MVVMALCCLLWIAVSVLRRNASYTVQSLESKA